MNSKPRVLFVDDDYDILELFTIQFGSKYEIHTAVSYQEVQTLLIEERLPFDVLLCDQHLLDVNGLEVVKLFKEKSPGTIRMIISAYKNFDRLVTAINEGEIYRFIVKPWNAEELEQVINIAIKNKVLEQENSDLLDNLTDLAANLESQNKALIQQKDQLALLLSILYEIQRDKDLLKKLDLVVQGIVASKSFRRAIIYLLNDKLEMTAFRYAGLSVEDVQHLLKRKPIRPEQRQSLLQEKYRLGNSYFIPYNNHNHIVEKEQTIPSSFPQNGSSDWHPEDILLIPLYGLNRSLVGLLSLDDPYFRKRPTSQELHIIELFAHEAGIIIEQEQA